MKVESPNPDTGLERYWFSSAGLTIVSSLPLDDLAEVGIPGRPDISIEEIGASVADEYTMHTTHVVSIGEVGAPWLEVRRGPSGYLARWPGALDVIIPNDGRQMLVHRRASISDSVGRLLLCQAMSFVLPSHGREGFHASAVEIDGRAVIISGKSGRGKSTLATTLCRKGGRLLSDDLTSVRLAPDGTPLVDVSSKRVWLMREVAASMFGEDRTVDVNRLHKVAVGGDGVLPATGSVPLAGVYLMGHKGGEPEISEPMRGKQALAGLLAALFNFVIRTPERLDLQFKIATEICARAPVRALRWEVGPVTADLVADRIIEQLRAGRPAGANGAHQNGSHANGSHATGGPNGGPTNSSHGNGPHANGRKESVMIEPDRIAGDALAEGEGVLGVESEVVGTTVSPERRRLIDELRRAGVQDVPDDDDEPLLRTSQVAALLRSSDRTIRTWADAGKLPYIKTLGGRRLFPASAVMAVLRSMQGGSRKEG